MSGVICGWKDNRDCIASIATLHHLPLGEILGKMKGALRSGGTLIVLDLFQGEGPADVLGDLLAVPVSVVLRLIKTGRLRRPGHVREAWSEHGKRDRYLSMPQISQICADVLSGATLRKHLLWRYSITWKKAES